MITIRNTQVLYIETEAPYIKTVVAEIDCDTTSELPTPTSLNGYILHQGTVADIIKEGKLAKLGGDGKWYSPTGELIKE